MKVINLYEMIQGLNGVLDKELPTKVAFDLQKNLRNIQHEAKPADELKKKLNEKFKDYIDEGRIENKEKREAYLKELEEINAQEVEVELIKVNLDDLGESIKPRTLYLIEPMIKIEEEDK